MSKSLKRVRAALDAAEVTADILEMPASTRTAADAAAAAACEVDQIAISIIFARQDTGNAVLFISAGCYLVDPDKAAATAGTALTRADAALVRAQTGFAIGGVAPIGHLSPCQAWFDPRLLAFSTVYAAAGTPRHIFAIAPDTLLRISEATRADFCA